MFQCLKKSEEGKEMPSKRKFIKLIEYTKREKKSEKTMKKENFANNPDENHTNENIRISL